MITINGIELEYDCLDADVLAREEEATEKYISLPAPAGKGQLNSEWVRDCCRNVFEYFNAIFGPGTDKKLFGDRTNLLMCLDAVSEFKAQAAAQADDVKERLSKYAPARAARQ